MNSPLYSAHHSALGVVGRDSSVRVAFASDCGAVAVRRPDVLSAIAFPERQRASRTERDKDTWWVASTRS
jgi:hypothetical protein